MLALPQSRPQPVSSPFYLSVLGIYIFNPQTYSGTCSQITVVSDLVLSSLEREPRLVRVRGQI